MFWHASVLPSVCPQGGVPISHNALQHFPECHGADTGGEGGYPARSSRGGEVVPCQVQPGGYPARGVPCRGGPMLVGVHCEGGTLPRGVPMRGGYPARGYPAGGVPMPRLGYPAQGVPCWGGYPAKGGTQVGQQKEYSIHGGQYASCVHAGGLSCLFLFWFSSWGSFDKWEDLDPFTRCSFQKEIVFENSYNYSNLLHGGNGGYAGYTYICSNYICKNQPDNVHALHTVKYMRIILCEHYNLLQINIVVYAI